MNDTPRKRARRTRPGVRRADRIAALLIRIGGIGTIVAVSVVCAFLVSVAVPLFWAPSSARATSTGALPGAAEDAPCALGVNEYLTMGWSASSAGELRCFRLEDGVELQRALPLERPPSALAVAGREGRFDAGFPDGVLRSGSIGFSTRFLAGEEVPAELRALPAGRQAVLGRGIVEHTPTGQFRLQELALHSGPPLATGDEHALVRIDGVETSTGPVLASLSSDHVLHLARVTRTTNLLTGEETLALDEGRLALELLPAAGLPRWLLLTGLGDNVFLVWEDGTFWRCDARTLSAPRVVEKSDLLPEAGERVTALAFLIGRSSIAVGDDRGRIRIWFRVKPANAGTVDGIETACAHELAGPTTPVSAVTALSASARSRLVAAGYADGGVRLYYATTQAQLFEARVPGPAAPVRGVALAPKDDGLLAASSSATALWRIDVPHPETSLAGIFAPVWYEGYEGPAHVWQSSSGTDDFEPKYGLVPLVFGSLKATLYSLLFGVPIALLAAVYTSEFLHPRHKARIKPTIEVMASLPSVVLGFLAALVIAPVVEDVVPQVLLALVLLPFCACLGGYAWRLLPTGGAARLERFRLPFVALCLLAGLGAASVLGPAVERALFAGDFRQWTTGTVGGGAGGWMILILPVAVLLVGWSVTAWVNPRLLRVCRDGTRSRFALLDLSKFLLAALATLALAGGAALLLERCGLDSRGGVLDTYVQRNALVVGFVMGFAIIPIVYTLAEDALAAVPEHLRAASLGAGATPWQTTLRIVVPTAMSGIFSAVMIGFGRAVGETMIVLMAAGNTPILDWNVFNGFRTLSANIAVELPEAVQGSTHYRMLFLAALVLFALTFALNTAAEVVRQRYRLRRVNL